MGNVCPVYFDLYVRIVFPPWLGCSVGVLFKGTRNAFVKIYLLLIKSKEKLWSMEGMRNEHLYFFIFSTKNPIPCFSATFLPMHVFAFLNQLSFGA